MLSLRWLLPCALVLVACPGSNGVDGGTPGDADGGQLWAEWCDQLAAKRCDAAIACKLQEPTLREDCLKAEKAGCSQTYLNGALKEGLLTFNAAAATACLDAQALVACNPAFGAPFFSTSYPQACAGVFTAAGTPGSQCTTQNFGLTSFHVPTNTCAAGFCSQAPTACGGTCSALGKPGERCRTSSQCQADAGFCDFSDGGMDSLGAFFTCAPLRKKDEPCTGARCEAGLRCATAVGAASTCQELIAAGQPCPAGTGCVSGAFCDARADAGNCTQLPATGQPCEVGGRCASGSYCQSDAGTCQVLKKLDEACDFDIDNCGFPSFCGELTNTCVSSFAVVNGKPCNEDGDCVLGSYCKGVTATAAGVCAPYEPLNGACVRSDDCVWSAFCVGDAGVATCMEIGSLNQPCATASGCKTPLACDVTANACKKTVKLDEGCAFRNDAGQLRAAIDCETGFCNTGVREPDGGFYVAPSDKCEPLKADGAPCGTSGSCTSTYCNVAGIRPPDAGEVLPPNRTCAPLRALGEFCSVSAQCSGGFCNTLGIREADAGYALEPTNRCTAFRTLGQRCTSGSTVHCGPGNECRGSTCIAACKQ